ncbi:MAG: AmmeMemoRadiSam system radical SAM enzyme [Spirochaetaceae bacterium]|jgi:pyruvate formate lyase activating enzyme|nr:AmmeMemoRadiSam system radical SAM enzyme [Spirochaetaceae bacterium]
MNDALVCDVCPHACALKNGQCGFCGARANNGGKIVCINYGYTTSIALDPIEKKPLNRYKSGSLVLSIGSFGCNFRCPFCQNHSISMSRPRSVDDKTIYRTACFTTKEELALKAESLRAAGNIGIAYTYNEPLAGYEFVYDTAAYIKARDMDNVIVTNGCINSAYFEKLLPFTGAVNIDLKTYNAAYYQTLAGLPAKNAASALALVKNNITLAAARCHVELTCLVIPGENDSPEEMDAMSTWIASVSPTIPLHITRFFPRYHYADRQPTPLDTLRKLEKIARSRLRFVYLGNV